MQTAATSALLIRRKKRPCIFSIAHSALTVINKRLLKNVDGILTLIHSLTGNFGENHPSVAIAMLVVGVQYPLWATGLGVGWIISRIVYAIGYTRKDKTGGEGRLAGSAFWLCQLGLFGLMGWMGVQMVL